MPRRRTFRSIVLVGLLAIVAGAEPGWATGSTVTGSMVHARVGAMAVLLSSGKVLVAGGGESTPGTGTDWAAMNSAELFDPATGTWRSTGSIAHARTGAAALRLADGRVLLVGGITNSASSTNEVGTSTEIYTPATGTWAAGASTRFPHSFALMTPLPDGTVLVASGANRAEEIPGVAYVSGDSGVGGPAEIYDPATSTWRTTSPMLLADAVMSAVLLPDGRVFSGCGDAPGNFELYSPHATLVRRLGLGLWRMAAPAPVVLHRCALSLLPDGRVLVAGGVPTGVDSSPVASAYIYDPVSDAWTGAGSMNAPRAYGVATALADGRVLVSGGTDANLSVFDGTEIYDPASDEWALATATPSLQLARTCCVTTTLLADGTVLIAGGTGFPNSPDYPEDLAEAEIIQP